MIFVIGLWTFLRALLFGPAAVALENLALRHQLLVLQRSVDPTPAVSLGPGLLGLAVTRVDGVALQSRHRSARHRPGLAPPRLPALLALEVHRQPGGPPEARRRDSPPDPPDGSRESNLGPPTHPGGTRPPRLRRRRTDRRQVHAPNFASALAHVARFSRPRMPERSSPSTSSWSPPSPSACSSSSSSSAMTAASSSMSTSRIIPPQSGPPARSSRPSRTRPLRDICSEIVTPSTARPSPGASPTWGSAR